MITTQLNKAVKKQTSNIIISDCRSPARSLRYADILNHELNKFNVFNVIKDLTSNSDVL